MSKLIPGQGRWALWLLCVLVVPGVHADIYAFHEDDQVVGNIHFVTIEEGDALIDLGRRYDVGFDEMKLANQAIDPWIPPGGTQVLIPTRYVLPNTELEGIVINLAELRLYYFPPRQGEGEMRRVMTYPISIGSEGEWSTPLTRTKIIGKQEKPNWYPPESILKEHEEKGDPLPKVVPAGPDNPLGDYAMRLGLTSYLIHSTNVPRAIGMRVTHGCIRLHPDDIQVLFPQVPINTPVTIVNQIYKVAWHNDRLYLESHASVKELEHSTSRNLTEFVQTVVMQTQSLPKDSFQVDWEKGYREAKTKRGIPVAIATRGKSVAKSREPLLAETP